MEKDCSIEDKKSEKSNWFKSLSRRRKTASNKENTQNSNVCSSDSSESPSSHSTKKTATKNTNVLYVLGKCLNLKFLSRQNELMSRQGIVPSHAESDSSSSHFLRHQNLAVSNDYVETPTTLGSLNRSTNHLEMSAISDIDGISSRIIQMHTDISHRLPVSPWLVTPTTQNEMTMLNARVLMNNYGWYRGSMSRNVAQKKLQGQPNGSFLLRNSQTKGYHFTLSFRSAGITLHYRIEYSEGNWIIESAKYISIVDLIEDAMMQSKKHIFCYVKPCSQLQPAFPVRLTNPISKFDEVPSLQHICRYVIRSSDRVKSIDCLPTKLQEYVKANKYLNIRLDYFEDV